MADLISRQAAIDEIVTWLKDRMTDRKNGKPLTDRIKDLPSAQKGQRWIPVSERLPKVGQTVICQCRADILKLLKLDSGGDWYQDAEHAYMNGFVIAWMKLPKPYKGDES